MVRHERYQRPDRHLTQNDLLAAIDEHRDRRRSEQRSGNSSTEHRGCLKTHQGRHERIIAAAEPLQFVCARIETSHKTDAEQRFYKQCPDIRAAFAKLASQQIHANLKKPEERDRKRNQDDPYEE